MVPEPENEVAQGIHNVDDLHGGGYDLTGNASGVCPECGTEIRQP